MSKVFPKRFSQRIDTIVLTFYRLPLPEIPENHAIQIKSIVITSSTSQVVVVALETWVSGVRRNIAGLAPTADTSGVITLTDLVIRPEDEAVLLVAPATTGEGITISINYLEYAQENN